MVLLATVYYFSNKGHSQLNVSVCLIRPWLDSDVRCFVKCFYGIFHYLAPNFVWERGIVLLVWVCDSVCLFVVLLFRDHDNSKSSRPISIKISRTLSYIKNKAKFKFDKNCFGRTRTLSNRKFKISITQKVIAKYLQNFTEWCVKSFWI